MAGPSRDTDWIALYLDAAAAEQGAAQNTLLGYGRDLTDAMGWLSSRGGFAGADRAKLESYIASLEADGLAPATRARRLSALKQLYRFAHEEGWRSDNPAIQITGPARARKLPGTLSLAEVDALLDAAETHGRHEGDRLRNRCLMQILYATGLRVTELVSLPVAALRGDPAMLLVLGKGGKERIVPLSPPAREAAAAWLAHRDAEEESARVETGADLPREWLCSFERYGMVKGAIAAKKLRPITRPRCLLVAQVGKGYATGELVVPCVACEHHPRFRIDLGDNKGGGSAPRNAEDPFDICRHRETSGST